MKLRSCCLALVAVLSATGLAAAPSNVTAQDIPPSSVAVFDFQRILRESAAAIDVRAKVERQRQFYQDEITKEERELRALEQELGRQRAILTPEAFAKKRRDFESRVAKVQRQVQSRKRELDQAYDYGLKQVREAMGNVIAEIAKERGVALVLSRQQVMYVDDALNISDEVLTRLNQRLHTVEVPLAQN